MRKFVRTRSGGAQSPDARADPAPHPAPHPAPSAATHAYTNGVHGDVCKSGFRATPRSPSARALTPGARSSGSGWAGGGRSVLSSSGAGLWSDNEFCGWRALAGKKTPNVKWLRVTELSSYPRFFGDLRVRHAGSAGGAESAGSNASDRDDDSDEEICDDCPERWLWRVGEAGSAGACAGIAAVAATPRLLRRAVPPTDLRAARGRLRFRLWDGLRWRAVEVDDRLAVWRGRLLGAASAAPHDYTLALLEKALAKMAGSYAALRAGGAGAALQALTGGVLLETPLSPPAARSLLPALAPLATVILVHNEEYSCAGVVCGLARVRGGAVLVRLRGLPGAASGVVGASPAGSAAGGSLWRALPPPDRELLAARLTHPQDCWLSLEELCARMSAVSLCALAPELAGGALRGRRAWRAAWARRGWRRGATAGGPPPHAAAAANPAFSLQLSRPALLLTSLAAGGPPVPVDMALYRVEASGAALRAAAWHNASQAAALWRLAPGRYVLVPHAPRHHTAPFLLRLLTDVPADAWEVDEDNLLLRDISEDFLEEGQPVPPDLQRAAAKILGEPYVEEVSVAAAAEALVRSAGVREAAAAARALAALRAGRGGSAGGSLRAADLPPLVTLLHAWSQVWRDAPLRHRCGRTRCSYALRGLLRACGVSVSNRVLLACAPARCRLARPAFLLALARLHLAHERFRRLDNSIKNNPITLEEMILMTLYS